MKRKGMAKSLLVIVLSLLLVSVVTLSGAGCAEEEASVADFSATPTSGTTPLTVSFTDKSTGDIDTWQWDFGDGTTSTERNPTHSYTTAGDYTVKLTVTGPEGSDTKTVSSYILVSPPEEGTGTLRLYLSDAPIDNANVTGVYIKINEIQYHLNGGNGEWVTLEEFEGPQTYNLLELTGGNFALLGEFELPAGQYTQIRFMLDIPEHGSPPTSPGCYIQFEDETTQPLFVPSGGSSGYKAVGAFEVPVNGEVEVTADFDVRKAVHVTGQGQSQRYILKPTIRLIVNNQAGTIGGSITNGSGYTDIIVYAYQYGTWDDTEADEPPAEQNRFRNAITSCRMGEGGQYALALLFAGTYDLVVAGFDGDAFGEVLGLISGVEVQSEQTTTQDIDTSSLETSL